MQVCREYQRGVCTRTQSECRYAHPPNGMAVDADNHVTVCMDFIKGRCHRETCRYFHPPPHLQAQIKTSQQRAIVSCIPVYHGGRLNEVTNVVNRYFVYLFKNIGLQYVREKSKPVYTFYNSGKQRQMSTKFCTNNRTCSRKHITKFQ